MLQDVLQVHFFLRDLLCNLHANGNKRVQISHVCKLCPQTCIKMGMLCLG